MAEHLLSCDWGTSSFRLRLIKSAGGLILAETISGKGIASVYDAWMLKGLEENKRIAFFKDYLSGEIKKLNRNDLDGVPMIISGMASSSIGMTELPYKEVPFSLETDDLNIHRLKPDEKFPHEVALVSGVRTKTDVMRGEETLLLGCGIVGDDEQLVIFPGTHSKHIRVKNNTLTGFETFMTGEFFELLSKKSILSKSIEPNEIGFDEEVFEKGLREGFELNLLNAVFRVRSASLFKSLKPGENYHYLSGILIGSELKGILPAEIKIQLVCAEPLGRLYRRALELLYGGPHLNWMNADRALITGHCRLAEKFF